MLYLLAIITLLWLALPFIPALVELKRPRDTKPLSIASHYHFDRRNTAEAVAQEVYAFLRNLVAVPDRVLSKENQGMDVSGRFRLIGDADDFSEASTLPSDVCKIVVCRETIDLQSPVAVSGPVYAGTSFLGSRESEYDSLFGEADVYLGNGTRIRNSLFAKGYVVVDRDSELMGSVHSDCQILVRSGCSFERLEAPSIVFGSAYRRSKNREAAARWRGPEPAPIIRGDRSYVEGDLVLSRNAIYEGNLVVEGRLLIRSGANIRGNIKSRQELTIEDHVTITGHVFCAASATVGRSVELRGVINVEGVLHVAGASRIGSWDCAASVVADTLIIEEGVHVNGTVWAVRKGMVVNAEVSSRRLAA